MSEEETSFWSLNGGIAIGDILVDGISIGVVIEPRFEIFPDIFIGSKNGLNFATDGVISLEAQVYLRWNFWQFEAFGFNPDVFIQGGAGFLGALRGPGDKNHITDSRSSVLGDITAGLTIPFASRWQIEPSFRVGYPFIFGFALTAGIKLPLTTTKIRTEIITETIIETAIETVAETITETVKETVTEIENVNVDRIIPSEDIRTRMVITQSGYILFGADSPVFNRGIDTDARALNELVLNNVARILTENPEFKVRLEGHANPVTRQESEVNELTVLSQRRAEEVARLLKIRGVKEEQIIIVVYGGTRTISSDHDHWNMNRRVEIIIVHD